MLSIIEKLWEYLRKFLLKNAVSIEHISAPLNVTGEAYHWKTIETYKLFMEQGENNV